MRKLLPCTGFIVACLLFFTQCANNCKDVSCINGSVCFDGECDCPIGFSGAECEREFRAVFLGTFSLDGECENSSSYIRITRNSQRGDYLYIENLLNEPISVMAQATRTEFEIPQQSYLSGFLSGTGSYQNEALILTYTFETDSDTTTCYSIGNKIILP